MSIDIKRLLCLILLLTIITLTVIFIRGDKYTIKFDIVGTNYSSSVDDEEIVEIINEKEIDGKYLVTVKGLKEGHTTIDVSNDTSGGYGRFIYVHKSGIVTEDNFFGKCTGDEIIPISISIVIIYSLYILIKRYRRVVKENLYQYRNVAYLGIIIFLTFFAIINTISIFNYRGFLGTVDGLIGIAGYLSIVLLPVALVTFILVTISNIRLIIKEGKSWKNLLGLFLGIFIIVLTLLPDRLYLILLKSQKVNIFNLNGPGPYIYNFVESLIYLSIAYLECILISTIVIAIKATRKKLKYNKDYMIILGCQVRKDGKLTPLLKGRVDKALEFRNKQLEETGKDLIFIGSGGKGSNEPIAEGEAIKNYLIEQGINKKNILVDDKSTNTYENIMYSNKLIKKKNANIAFATTNYHVLRAGLLATSQGLLLEGVGGKTKAYFWINAFIREFIGTLYSEKKKHLLVLLIIIILLILMIIVTYFAYNL